jgi:hypothetical protein
MMLSSIACVCRGWGWGPGSWNHDWVSPFQITIVKETSLGTNRRGRSICPVRSQESRSRPLQGANEMKDLVN